jgi:hypothetical protein
MSFPKHLGLGDRPVSETPCKIIQALLLALVAFLAALLAGPSVLGQTASRANASLRITVNVVPVVQTQPSDQGNKLILIPALSTPRGGVILVWPEGWESLTLIEEKRKLTESGWESARPAISSTAAETCAGWRVQEVLAAFSSKLRNQGKASAPGQDTDERSEALLLTQTVVPH